MKEKRKQETTMMKMRKAKPEDKDEYNKDINKSITIRTKEKNKKELGRKEKQSRERT